MNAVRSLVLTALACVALDTGLPAGTDPAERPVESGLLEETGRRLVQLDVTVRGPRDQITALTREDFDLVVGGNRIQDFRVDSLCRLEPETTAPDEGRTPDEAAPAVVPPRVVSHFLFYFDQNNLTQAGRVRSLEVASELIPELIVNGNRGTVVSNGRELRTFADLSADPQELLDAVGRLAKDPKQWDPSAFAFDEEQRIRDVLDELSEGDVQRATQMVLEYQRDERWRIERALRRFALVMARMADLDAPKAVIYFADTMRSNPGEHYLGLLASSNPEFKTVRGRAFMAQSVFESVIAEATANGVRLYTIQAEGLIAPITMSSSNPTTNGHVIPNIGMRRVKDAQNSLVTLAQESGGKAFLDGVRSTKIAQRILEDLSCLYLISFDASALALDQSLPVRVRATNPKVETQVRGQVLVQSEEKRQRARLLAAFSAPSAVNDGVQARGIVIPTGFADGTYSGLVQFSVPGSPVPDATWDLGVSLVSQNRVDADAAGQVSLSGAGMPVVFEAEMAFDPGEYEIVGVAHETRADEVVTRQIEGTWPDPDAAPATVGPIAVLQPFEGVFLRGGEIKRSGPLGLGENDLALTDRQTALISLVCRGRATQGRLRIERRLSGETVAPFEAVDLELSKTERCVQIRDVIPAGVMSAGAFAYEIHVLRKDEEVAVGRREFGTREGESATLGSGPPASSGR